ncbi:MAG: recombination regulator RecX [Castellaniella sp.]
MAIAGGPSLKARAIAHLSRREHSRRELERKLAPHASDARALAEVLDALEDDGWQSDERFAQSLLNRRAGALGIRRIRLEMREHGLDPALVEEVLQGLDASEEARAREVWERKFGQAAVDARDYARQYRFMMSRGFGPDCLRRILSRPPA